MHTPELFFTVCTAGHVDHGKTSLIKKLTGIDPDRLKEEKTRQMTTDLGFAHMDVVPPANFDGPPIFKVGFIDVPGHGKFLKNMLAGVGCLDLALLVVAATEGVMPQTRQHAEILKILGVHNVLIAITKIDLSSALQLQETTAQIKELLASLSLNDLDVVSVSCATGVGFADLVQSLSVQLAKVLPMRDGNASKRPLLFPVDRAFKKSGFGSVVTGTLASGQLKQDDTVWVLPDKVKARVRKLESFGSSVDVANPGQRVAINLVLKDEIELARGALLSASNLCEARNLLLSLQDPYAQSDVSPVFANGTEVRIYHGTAEYQGVIGWCQASEQAGNASFAHVLMRQPFFAQPGDLVVVRKGDDAVVGGNVLTTVRPRWLNRAGTVELLSKLIKQEYEDAVEFVILANSEKMVKCALIKEMLPERVWADTINSLINKASLVQLGEVLIGAKALEALQGQILDRLDEMLTAQRQSGQALSISLDQLRAAKFKRVDRASFAHILTLLENQGKIGREGNTLLSKRLKSDSHSEQSEILGKQIEKYLSDNLCLEIEDLASRLGTDSPRLKAKLKELEKRGSLRIIAHDFVSSTASVKHAHEMLAVIWQDKHEITPAEFKERLNTTRKYAMPLLSFFDDELITRRSGQGRIMLKFPKKAD